MSGNLMARLFQFLDPLEVWLLAVLAAVRLVLLPLVSLAGAAFLSSVVAASNGGSEAMANILAVVIAGQAVPCVDLVRNERFKTNKSTLKNCTGMHTTLKNCTGMHTTLRNCTEELHTD
jgi:hypothetical protein